ALEPRRERFRDSPELGGGDDKRDTGHRAGFGRLDPVDPRVRVRAPREAHAEHLRQRQVVEITSVALQEPRVLEPPDAGAAISRRQAAPRSPSRWKTSPSSSFG